MRTTGAADIGASATGSTDASGADIGDQGLPSFERAPSPPGARVVSATLLVYQSAVLGLPYTLLGRLPGHPVARPPAAAGRDLRPLSGCVAA